ncbi:MAG: hypothetical protein QM496_06525 [Verrucomicrobiota bacterium]
MMRQWIFIFCMVGMAGFGFSQNQASAEKQAAVAQLPYHELVKIAQSDSSQNKMEGQLTFVLASNNQVPLDQIVLTLQLKKGPLTLPLDDKGHFSLPFSESLMEENPLMVSNQPRGSLSLKFTLSVPEMGKVEPPKVVEGKVKYRQVFQSLVKFKQAMKKVDTRFGEDGNQQLAVQCVTGAGGLTVHLKFGSRKLKAAADGTVWLLYDERLFQEDPSISVPEGTEFFLRPVSPEKLKEIKKQ